jgi:hypothetical protein
MIGTTVSHYEITERLGEARLHPTSSGFVGQGGPARRNLINNHLVA